MRHEDLRIRLLRYREAVEDARRSVDAELNSCLPSIVTREIDKLRKQEADALKLLVVAELFVGFQDDPDALAAWMLQCVEAEEIVERLPVEHEW